MRALLRLTTFLGVALFACAVVREARSSAATPRLIPPKHNGRAVTARKRQASAASGR